jgi:type I restriction enzyme M protein
LTNEKPSERVGKIQLIDATSFFLKMRKSLGNKRNYLSIEDIKKIVELYDKFEENKYCKIFDTEVFGYTKVIVERPLQLNYQVAEERLENLYSVKAFAKLAESKKKNPELKLKEEEEGRKEQEEINNALKAIENNLYKSWDEFETKVKDALKEFDVSPNLIKSIILALAEHDDTADYVLDKKGNKLPDSNLRRDSEKIPLKQDIEKYFEKEVKPYYPDAWMERKKDKIGYEINFTKYFYEYKPPRPLEKIEKDIKEVIGEIQELFGVG